jgi:hypothetical protein
MSWLDDHRIRAKDKKAWWHSLDDSAMTALVKFAEEDMLESSGNEDWCDARDQKEIKKYEALRLPLEVLEVECNEDDNPSGDVFMRVPIKYEVCDTCSGRGRHVDPAIDSCGLTQSDFDEDPGFKENYFGGMYDVDCYGCGGKRVMPVVDEATCKHPSVLETLRRITKIAAEEAAERAADRKMQWMEMGCPQ